MPEKLCQLPTLLKSWNKGLLQSFVSFSKLGDFTWSGGDGVCVFGWGAVGGGVRWGVGRGGGVGWAVGVGGGGLGVGVGGGGWGVGGGGGVIATFVIVEISEWYICILRCNPFITDAVKEILGDHHTTVSLILAVSSPHNDNYYLNEVFRWGCCVHFQIIAVFMLGDPVLTLNSLLPNDAA